MFFAAAALRAEDPRSGPDSALAQARQLTAEGKTSEAGAAYRQWLETSPPGAEYAAVLREALDSQRAVQAVLSLLADFTPRVPDASAREQLQAERVELLRLLGRYDEALGAAKQLPESAARLYLEALLYYEQGLFGESAEAARRALQALAASADAALEARVRHVLARALLDAGQSGEAEAVLAAALARHADSPETPALLLARVELLLSSRRTQEAAAAATELARRFPNAPETALAAQAVAAGGAGGKAGASAPGPVSYAPSPHRLLPPELPAPAPAAPPTASASATGPATPAPAAAPVPVAPVVAPPPAPAAPVASAASPAAPSTESAPPTPSAAPTAAPSPAAPGPRVLLQTGSFRDPENAQYMVRDLKARGFAADVQTARVGEHLYYRVLVGPPQSVLEAQALLVRLKEAGFEGMLYFP